MAITNVDPQLLQEIVNLLVPHMTTDAERRARLSLALSDTVYRQVDFHGPSDVFTPNMVSTLLRYGEVASGKQAIIAVLDVIYGHVGVNYQCKIDKLKQKLLAYFTSRQEGGIPCPQCGVANSIQAKFCRTCRYPLVPQSIVQRPTNLGFEDIDCDYTPRGWCNSYGYVSGVSINYEIMVIARPDLVGGACVQLKRDSAYDGEFGSLMQRIPGSHLAGSTVRLFGELRTHEVKSWAGLWLRVDSVDNQLLFFDNMYDRPITGTTQWTTYSIDAHLPHSTAWLNYGIVFQGNGTVWADNFRLLVQERGGIWVNI